LVFHESVPSFTFFAKSHSEEGTLNDLSTLCATCILRQTEARTRPWIEAFFFRASAMLPPDKRMVLNMEQVVPAETTHSTCFSNLAGFVDYTAIVTSQPVAEIFLTFPHLRILKLYMPSAFLVIEAKLSNPLDDLPQAVCNMYACGKFLKKKVVRGVLTNGCDWIFLLVKLNDDWDGATYKFSTMMKYRGAVESLNGEREILAPWPDLIAAVLLYWVENSFVDLGSDDWFELRR